jgi:hypothetical protein
MANKTSIRWVMLAGALVAAVVAALRPVEADMSGAVVSTAPPQVTARPAQHPVAVRPLRRGAWLATDVDPFAPKGWQPAAPVDSGPKLAAAAAPPPATPEPARPQVLPYQFVGQMMDGQNRVVYMGRGDQVLVVRLGDVVDGTYKVVGVTDSEVEFESLASGVKQSLSIPPRG